MKPTLSLILSLVMVLTLVPFSAFSVGADIEIYTDSQGAIYTLSNDETYYIVSDCDRFVTLVVIPDEINGLPVKEIGDYAFEYCGSLKSIEIPDLVTSIGDGAFEGCSSLKSIEIPDSVEIIDQCAFNDCESLETITVSKGNEVYHSNDNCLIETATKTLVVGCKYSVIPSDGSVKIIGKSAFAHCDSIASIKIPDSVTDIGDCAFKSCSSLTSVELPNSVTYIGYEAFSYCDSLTSVKIPNSVTSIGYRAFDNCHSLKSIEIPDSVTDIGDSAFSYCDSLTSVKIPSSVTYIGAGAFEHCGSLTSIEIPNSVTYVGDGAFEGCSSLKSIEIPDSVETIGQYAFYDCESLETITVSKGNEVYHSNGNCLIKTVTKTLIQGCNNSVIPSDGSVTAIANCAFRYCSGLTSIEIPNSVTYIGAGAFNYCYGLETITVSKGNEVYHSNGNCLIETAAKILVVGCKNSVIPSDGSVTIIGKRAFVHCDSLASVKIPNSVTSIDSSAFSECYSLKSIEIPDSVTYIGHSAFSECYNLTIIEIPDSVIYIGSSAFSGCYNLTSIEIPETAVVGACIFDGCSKITFSEYENIKYYGNANNPYQIAYERISFLSTYKLHPQTKQLAGEFFIYCDNLTSVEIPNSVTTIGHYAFANCHSLKNIEIPGSVIRIGDSAFSYCSNLTTIEIPDSVTHIGSSAFSGCYNLTSIEIPETAVIGKSIFDGCSNITFTEYENIKYYGNTNNPYQIAYEIIPFLSTYKLHPQTKQLSGGLFSECYGLTIIGIPNSVTTIGSWAFYGCTYLTDIYCEAESQPEGWGSEYYDDYGWNDGGWNYGCDATIHWGVDIDNLPNTQIGDIDGNGELGSMDYLYLKRAYFSQYTLSNKSIGDIDGDGAIGSMDYLYLKRAYFSQYVIG